MDGGPDGRLGRAIEVPHLHAHVEQAGGERRRQRLSSRQTAQAGPPPPSRVEKQPPRRGRGLHEGGARLCEEPAEPRAVQGILAAGDHHLRAHGERQEQLEGRNVERQTRHREQDISRGAPGRPRHGQQQVHQRPVRDLHALGPARGTGRVYDVGQIVSRALRLQVVDRGGGQHGGIGVQSQERDRRRQRQRHPIVADEHGNPGIGQHEAETFGRIGGIERHVRPTRLQHADEGDQQIERAVESDANQHVAADAQGTQVMRHLVGAAVQLGVGQALGATGSRHRIGRTGHLALEEHRPRGGRHRHLGPLPLREQQPALGRGQQRQRRDRALGVGDDRLQHRVVVRPQPPDRRRIEQLGAVLHGRRHDPAVLAELHRQVDLGASAVDDQRCQGHPEELRGLLRDVLEADHHVEQG
jgi:hypothetical protein